MIFQQNNLLYKVVSFPGEFCEKLGPASPRSAARQVSCEISDKLDKVGITFSGPRKEDSSFLIFLKQYLPNPADRKTFSFSQLGRHQLYAKSGVEVETANYKALKDLQVVLDSLRTNPEGLIEEIKRCFEETESGEGGHKQGEHTVVISGKEIQLANLERMLKKDPSEGGLLAQVEKLRAFLDYQFCEVVDWTILSPILANITQRTFILEYFNYRMETKEYADICRRFSELPEIVDAGGVDDLGEKIKGLIHEGSFFILERNVSKQKTLVENLVAAYQRVCEKHKERSEQATKLLAKLKQELTKFKKCNFFQGIEIQDSDMRILWENLKKQVGIRVFSGEKRQDLSRMLWPFAQALYSEPLGNACNPSTSEETRREAFESIPPYMFCPTFALAARPHCAESNLLAVVAGVLARKKPTQEDMYEVLANMTIRTAALDDPMKRKALCEKCQTTGGGLFAELLRKLHGSEGLKAHVRNSMDEFPEIEFELRSERLAKERAVTQYIKEHSLYVDCDNKVVHAADKPVDNGFWSGIYTGLAYVVVNDSGEQEVVPAHHGTLQLTNRADGEMPVYTGQFDSSGIPDGLGELVFQGHEFEGEWEDGEFLNDEEDLNGSVYQVYLLFREPVEKTQYDSDDSTMSYHSMSLDESGLALEQ